MVSKTSSNVMAKNFKKKKKKRLRAEVCFSFSGNFSTRDKTCGSRGSAVVI